MMRLPLLKIYSHLNNVTDNFLNLAISNLKTSNFGANVRHDEKHSFVIPIQVGFLVPKT